MDCGLPVQSRMDFEWDPKKAKANDPARLSSLDDSSADEERWRSIGLAGGKVFFVV